VTTPPALRLSLVEEIALKDDERSITLASEHGHVHYGDLGPGLVRAFRRLAQGDCDQATLEKLVLDTDGLGGLSWFSHLLDQMIRRCFVEFTVWSGSRRLVGLHPTVPAYEFRLGDVGPETAYQASRFAYCRSHGGSIVIESPCSRTLLTLHDPRAAQLWAAWSQRRTVGQAADLTGLPLEVASQAARLLLSGGAIIDGSREAAEGRDRPLVTWEFHDLLFHARSRIGRHNYPVGATFRFLRSMPALPLDPAPQTGECIQLASAARRAQTAQDAALAAVMESRRSVREHGADPVGADELGEFLYRVARLRATALHEVRGQGDDQVESFEIGSKPFPAGGGLYELELYPVIGRCRGLDPGLYHYDARHHRLASVKSAALGFEPLLDHAMIAAGITARPQVLIVISARFGRVAWKYQTIAYATVLKNVGALYQSMYLVATAMGLAPCALGSGNSELFASLVGLSFESETSVGEFMLGSLPAGTPSAPPFITNVRPNSEIG
jgi:SagB-type dehydrogenase family enzyme